MDEHISPFDLILDRCLEFVTGEGHTVTDCLAQYPDQRESLEPLLKLALCLQTAQNISAPADFRLTAQTRMENLIAAYPRSHKHNHSFSGTIQGIAKRLRPAIPAPQVTLRWRLAGLAMILILFMAVSSVQASANSLPGQWLYPLKRTLENVEYDLAGSNAAQGNVSAKHTRERFNEVVGLAKTQPQQELAKASSNFQDQLKTTLNYVDSPKGISDRDRSALSSRVYGDLKEEEKELQALLHEIRADYAYRRDLNNLLVLIQGKLAHDKLWIALPPDQTPWIPGLSLTIRATEEPSRTTTRTPTPLPKNTAASNSVGGTHEPWNWGSEWPSEWPTLEETPGPDTQWTEINQPWSTMIPLPTQMATAIPTIYSKIETLIPSLPKDITTKIPSFPDFPHPDWPPEEP
ncbi:MAG TPA: DUF5667 domain-containing protein [Anaerolineaceae bacterium]|nr:DUF5667 domain-containing protein [Anaerolineaceae bacterium]